MPDLDSQFQHALASLAEKRLGMAGDALSLAARWREGDRRLARRYVYPVRVMVETVDRRLWCRVLDISAGGARIARPAGVALAFGDAVTVSVASTAPIAASVVNSDAQTLAVRFDAPQAALNVLLSDLLRRAAAKRLEMLVHVAAFAAEAQEAEPDDLATLAERHQLAAHASYAGVVDWRGAVLGWRCGPDAPASVPETLAGHGPPHALIARLAPVPEVRPRWRGERGLAIAEASAPMIRDKRRWGAAFLGFTMPDPARPEAGAPWLLSSAAGYAAPSPA
jgi:hypothetical protein